MVHVGRLIKAEMERQERTPSWLARHIGCDRTNVYRIYDRQSIDTELLLRISRVLHYDFFAKISLLAAPSVNK